MHTLDDNFLFGFCKNRTLNHKFPTECGRWQNMNLCMDSKSRFLCVFWRIVKARKVDRALHNVFCIVTLFIVIYVDNICIRWETDQKCSPKTLIGSVIVSVLASSPDRVKPCSVHIFCHLPHSVGNLWFRVLFLQNPNKKLSSRVCK